MNDNLIHDLIVDYVFERLKRDYKEIKRNSEGDPDLILSNRGLVTAFLEVETEQSISVEKAKKWAEISKKGKLILLVPKNSKLKATEFLWQEGVTGSVSIGTYEITINMP